MSGWGSPMKHKSGRKSRGGEEPGGGRPHTAGAVKEHRKMEPGGIEPPSRGSPRGASTRVYGDLISAAGPPPSACPLAQFPVTPRLRTRQPRAQASPMSYGPRPIGRRAQTMQP